ncbi:MAG: hypothetical protein V1752_00515, partial [Candidatus Firestonebacteria bacterium]
MKRNVIIAVIYFVVFVIEFAVGCPPVSDWNISPSVQAVNKSVSIKCTVKPGSETQKINSWNMTEIKDGVNTGNVIASGGGAGINESIRPSPSVKFEDPAVRKVFMSGTWEDTADPTGFTGATTSPEFTIYKILLDSVSGADSIGATPENVYVYATSKGSGNATIALKTEPAGVVLPANSITWTGGAAGSDQLHRNVSKSSLNESGVDVSATAGTIVKTKVYVFEAEPGSKDVNFEIGIIQDNSICTTPFGECDNSTGSSNPDVTSGIYYKDKKWRFVLKNIKYNIKYGINSGGNTNVTSGTMSPFPNGKNMPETSTQKERKTRAKEDLTPSPYGSVARTSYWSSSITTTHELFHATDWLSFYKPAMQST